MRKFFKMFRMLVPSVITFSLVSSPSAAMVNSSSCETEVSSNFGSGNSSYEFGGLSVVEVLSPDDAALLLRRMTFALTFEFCFGDKSYSDRIFKGYMDSRTVVIKNLLKDIDPDFVCNSSSFDKKKFLDMFADLDYSYFELDRILTRVEEEFTEKSEFKEIQEMMGKILNDENVRSRFHELQKLKEPWGRYEPNLIGNNFFKAN